MRHFAVSAASSVPGSRVGSIDELQTLVDKLDPAIPFPEEAHRMVRGHSHGPRRVRLPEGFLHDRGTGGLAPEAAKPVSGG